MNSLGIRDRELDKVIACMGAAFSRPHKYHRAGSFKKSKIERIVELLNEGTLHERVGKNNKRHRNNLKWEVNYNSLDPRKAVLLFSYFPPKK